jgi:putative membrane protein
MKILTWVLRFAVFLLLFMFAVHNTEPVVLHLVLGHVWQAPLAIVLLVVFALGALLGIFSLLGLIFRQRREISRLKRSTTASATPIDLPPSA